MDSADPAFTAGAAAPTSYSGGYRLFFFNDRGASGFPEPSPAPHGTAVAYVPKPAMALQGKCHEWFNSNRLMQATSSQESVVP